MNIHSSRSVLSRARMIRSARRNRSNRLYSKNSATSGSSKRTSSSSNSQTKQIAMYGQVEKYSNALTKNVDNMLAIGAKADPTQKDQAEMVSEIKEFVSNYNLVYDALGDLSGASNEAYQKSIAKITSDYSGKLEEIGITVSKENKLVVDTKALEAADFEKLKAVFGTKDSYGAKIGEKFEVIEQSAASSLNVMDKLFGASTYDSKGNYSNYGSYSGYNNYGYNDYFGSSAMYGGTYYNGYNNWG